MRNKKADLMNNVLTTIIAVVGLAIILFAAWKLYSVYANQEETNARKLADSIEGKIANLEDGQFGKIVVKGVPGWFVIGWGKNELDRPDKCYFQSCICICKGDVQNAIIGAEIEHENVKKRLGDSCQKTGFCRFYEQDNVGVFTVNNFKLNPFLNNPQDTLNFLNDSEMYESQFRAKLPPLGEGYQYTSYFYYDLVSFGENSQLEEFDVYHSKSLVGLLSINSREGDGSGASDSTAGMTTGSV